MKRRSCLLFLIATSCASNAATRNTSPIVSNSPAPSSNTETGAPQPTASLSLSAGDCDVRLVPNPDSVTREEFLQSDIVPALASTEEFLEHLTESQLAIADFASTSSKLPFHASVNDHMVRGQDLQALVLQTYRAMKALGDPTVYYGEDVLTYPQVFAVWQDDRVFRVLSLLNNNDNDAVSWWIGEGVFEPANLPVREPRVLETPTSILEVATFIEDSRTIYPHIEQYLLCGES